MRSGYRQHQRQEHPQACGMRRARGGRGRGGCCGCRRRWGRRASHAHADQRRVVAPQVVGLVDDLPDGVPIKVRRGKRAHTEVVDHPRGQARNGVAGDAIIGCTPCYRERSAGGSRIADLIGGIHDLIRSQSFVRDRRPGQSHCLPVSNRAQGRGRHRLSVAPAGIGRFQAIVVEVERDEWVFGDGCWHHPTELIAGQIQAAQSCDPAQCRRDTIQQMITGEIDGDGRRRGDCAADAAQLGRNVVRQVIGAEIQIGQAWRSPSVGWMTPVSRLAWRSR